MFKSIKEFFQQSIEGTGHTDNREHTLELCAAALMMEIALADSGISENEQKIIQDTVREHFHLNEDEAVYLIETARTEIDHSVSLHEFTKVVNESLSRDEKVTIIELLWKVAFADTVINKYEEYFIRKISDLLYVSHRDYIRAKHRAVE